MTWKTLVLSSALVLLPIAAAAQDRPQTQWQAFVQSTALQPQDEVYVTLVTGRRIRGRIGEITTAALTLADGEGIREYGEAEIASIERRDRIVSGVALGLLAGVGANAALLRGGSDQFGVIFAAFTVPTVLASMAIGGFVDSRFNELLYKAVPARVSVAPTVEIGNRGLGVRMSVGW